MAHIPTPRPKPAKKPKKSATRPKSNRKVLEKQIEAIVKQIVFWRDGVRCVESDIDGARCRGGLNWGHFIPRNKSKYLKFDLATFVQCDGHNMMHDSSRTGGGDPIFGIWFTETFGLDALKALSQEQRDHIGNEGKRPIFEMREMLERYDKLYQDRIYVKDTGNVNELVERGYYGEILQRVFRERNTNE